MCMDHSKTQTLNEAKETSTGTAHATDKLDKITNKLRQLHAIVNVISGNPEAIDEIDEQEVITDVPIHGPDALDVIAAELDQIFDELVQATDGTAQGLYEAMNTLILFGDY
jgi:hypothetical protein